MKKLINSNFNVRSSFDFGKVCPLFIKSTVPNDKIKLDFSVVSEMLTPLFETFDVSELEVFAFWQANKFIDKKFVNNFLNETKTNYAINRVKSSFISEKFSFKHLDKFNTTFNYNVNIPLYLLMHCMLLIPYFDLKRHLKNMYTSSFVNSHLDKKLFVKFDNGPMILVDNSVSNRYKLLMLKSYESLGMVSILNDNDICLDFTRPIDLESFVKYSSIFNPNRSIPLNIKSYNKAFDDFISELPGFIASDSTLSTVYKTDSSVISLANVFRDIQKNFNSICDYLSYFGVNVSDFLGTFVDRDDEDAIDSLNYKLKSISEMSNLPFLLYDSIMYEWFTDFELRSFFGKTFEFNVDGDVSLIRLKNVRSIFLSPFETIYFLKNSSNIRNPYINSFHLTPKFGNYDIDVSGESNIEKWQDFLKNNKRYNYDFELWQRTPKTYDKLIGTVFDFDKKKSDEYVKFLGKKTIKHGLTSQVVTSNDNVGRVGAFSRVSYSSNLIDTTFNDYGYLMILVCPSSKYSIKSLKPKWQREKDNVYQLKNNNKIVDKVLYSDVISVPSNSSLLSVNNVFGYCVSNNEFLSSETDTFVGKALYDDSLFSGRCFNSNFFTLSNLKRYDSKAVLDTVFYTKNSPLYLANFNINLSVFREV